MYSIIVFDGAVSGEFSASEVIDWAVFHNMEFANRYPPIRRTDFYLIRNDCADLSADELLMFFRKCQYKRTEITDIAKSFKDSVFGRAVHRK